MPIEKIASGILADRRVPVTVAVGMISGLVSALTFNIGHPYLAFSPGVSFGVLIGLLLLIFRLADLFRVFGVLLLSALTWYAAMLFAFFFLGNIDDFIKPKVVQGLVTGLVSGVLGAALLWGSAAFLLRWARNMDKFRLALIAGGLTGLLLATKWGALIPLFVLWQGCFALCLALCYPEQDDIGAKKPSE